MMQTLRNYMKHIIWIVAGGFIIMLVFSWGMGGFKGGSSPLEKGILGVIDGQKITYRDFAYAVQRQVETLREQSEAPINEYQINSIRQRVWQSLEQEILFAKEIKRLKLEASPEEIVFNLRNNPPPFLQSNEAFQTDGKFDMSKYQQALMDPQNYQNWIPVEEYFRTTIPTYKLQQMIISTVRVTDSEVREAYYMENEKMKVKYIFFDQNTVTPENIIVSDMEMEDYYQGHQDEFKEPEKRKLQYVLFEAKPSEEDSLQTQYDMEDIQRQISQGADFQDLAKEYSEDESNASEGGDLGFFGKGTMVKPFEDVAFSAKVGDIVGPVETPFGLHLIQIIARKTEDNETKVHARHILLKYKMSSETYNNISDRSEYISSEISKSKEDTFKELIELEGYTVQETPLFQKGGFIPGIGMSSLIGNYSFQMDLGWVSGPINFNENIILFRISEIQEERVKPFEDVKTSIESILTRQKKKERAGEFGQAVYSAISSGLDFEEVANENNLKVNETGLFSMQSTIPNVGRDPRFAGTAFRMKVNEISRPVEGNRGFYILKIVERIPMDEKMFETEKGTKKQALLQEKKQGAFVAWYTQLQTKAKIKDYRDQYF